MWALRLADDLPALQSPGRKPHVLHLEVGFRAIVAARLVCSGQSDAEVAMRAISLVFLMIFLLSSPAYAGDPEKSPAKDALLAAALECPLTLAEAMASAYGADRRPVRAELVLDTEDRLLMRATVRIAKQDDASFEAWVGLVHAAGWMPHKRAITEEHQIAEAAREWALLEADPNLLRKALKGAVRTEERLGPAEVALSIAPVERDGKTTISLRIGVNDRVRGLRFDPQTSIYALENPTAAPERVSYEAPTLPALDVADGTWFNVEEPPTLRGWLGSPSLVVVTDPG